MAGSKRKRNRPTLPIPALGVAVNTTIHPHAATGEDAATEIGTSHGLLGADTTNAPPRIVEEDATKVYAQTPSALADKHLLSKEPEFIFFGLLVVTILALAGIDDYAGRLNSGPGLVHFIWKCVMLAAIVLIMTALYWVFRKIKRWFVV